MKRLLDNLNNSFIEYNKKVDELYKEKTLRIDSLFGAGTADTFCRGISYIIRQFLESEDDTELFIQIPVDELASKPDLQDENFQKMQDAICHTLAMATYNKSKIEAPPVSQELEGEVFYTADSIECSRGETRPRIWKIRQGKNGLLFPDEQYPDKAKVSGNNVYITLNTKELQKIFENHIGNTYRLAMLPDNNNVTTRKKLLDMAKLLGVYKANPTSKLYKNALLIGFGNPTSLRICDIPWLRYPVDFEKKYENISNKHYEILVFAGDTKYSGRESRINNEIAYGYCKKVIYVGENKPMNYKGKVFSFTSRELYHYFANDKYPEFEIKKLQWTCLEQALILLTDIINNEVLNLDSDVKKRAITSTLAPYLGYTFFSDTASLNERLLDFLNDNAILNNVQWDTLVESSTKLEDISFKGNPKKQCYQLIRKECGNNPCLLLEAYVSYPNRIKKLCQKNKKQNTYVVDVCSDSNRYLDVVRYMFRKLAMGKVYFLTYFELNKIKDLLLGDLSVYNSNYRKSVLCNLEHPQVNRTEDQHYGSLDNFNVSLLDDLMTTYNSQNAARYTLTAYDGNEYDISGDVIKDKQIVNCGDLLDFAEDWLPCDLSFYIKPNCFQELRDILYDLPKGEDVDTYARLWKSKLQERCRSEYDSDAKTMWDQDKFKFMKLSTFKKVINDRYTSQFPNIFKRLAIQMYAIGLFTPEELQNSLKALQASREASSFGGRLKQGIYEYLLTDTCSVEEVRIICDKKQRPYSPYTYDKLKAICIKTATITKITQTNNRNGNDE